MADGYIAFSVTNRSVKKGTTERVAATFNIIASADYANVSSIGLIPFSASEQKDFTVPFNLTSYGNIAFTVKLQSPTGVVMKSVSKTAYFPAPVIPPPPPPIPPPTEPTYLCTLTDGTEIFTVCWTQGQIDSFYAAFGSPMGITLISIGGT